MRFRCISKPWSCLIRSRYFSNLYLTAASPSRAPLRLYMSLVEHYKYNFSNFYLRQYPRKRQLLSLRLSSPSNSAESSLEPDTTFPGMGGHGMAVLRGLILYSVCKKAFIYNPATRQSLTLPAIKSNIFAQKEPKYVHYFFGHDPVHDQYKIVCTVFSYPEGHEKITSEYWVFVLEPGGFWKRVEYYDQPHTPTRDGLCVNGVIYYLASTHTGDYVYSFDVRSEDFNKIQAPSAVSDSVESVGFMEHGGKPAIFDYTHIRETGVSELWVLEDGLGGTWSKTSLVLKPCQRHLVDDINIMDLRVYGTGQNNEVIMALTCPCYLLYYDLIKNDLRKVNINREMPPDQPLYVYVKIMDKSESIMQLQL